MKTLIVYYSLTGKTEKIIQSLQKTCCAERLELQQSHGYSWPGAYLFGAIRARKGSGAHLRPVDMDVSEFDRIILAGPVWAGAPAPALTGFLQSYDLTGCEIHGLLTYSGNAHGASARFRSDAEKTGAVCASVTTFKSSLHAIMQLETGKNELYLDSEGGIALRSCTPAE